MAQFVGGRRPPSATTGSLRRIQLLVLGTLAALLASDSESSLALVGSSGTVTTGGACGPGETGGMCGATSEGSGSSWNIEAMTGMSGPNWVLVLGTAAWYLKSLQDAKTLAAQESKILEAASGESKKKPRIDAFDSLRFFLIFYIASGHFIHTATKNVFILKFVSQINVVVGAFFVLSGYVAAYTTTELGKREGSSRLNNAVEFAVTRIMGFWPLHALVLLIFSPMFFWVDGTYSGAAVATWHGFISTFLLTSWFPLSAEIWNAPTWFLSAFAFALCILPYGLRIVALQKKVELRRTLVILTFFSCVVKLSYSYDLKAWNLMEGTLNARTHPNYALFNSIRFSPFAALMEVLMGAVACRLVMLDQPGDSRLAWTWGPLLAMIALVTLRAAGLLEVNDMLVRSLLFIPLWIVFLMRLHRECVSKEGANKLLPKLLTNKGLLFLGSISFPIFIVHGPVGQVFYKKAVATKVFGGVMGSPSPTGIDWFFGVYWLVVLLAAAALQKGFMENSTVKALSKNLSTAIIKLL